jgi:thiamine biosynthesis lipoprotein
MMRHILQKTSIILLCLSVLQASCTRNKEHTLFKINRLLLGTLVEITVVGDRKVASKAAHAAADEIKRVEDLTSFHASSQLSLVNDGAGKGPEKADKELLSLVKTALDFARESNGSFDPTIGPLSRLWGFSSEKPHLPNRSEIDAALKLVGWNRVSVDQTEQTIKLPQTGMSLDLGAIAKGYALDRGAVVLKRLGITSALINAGGDIIAIGEKKPGKPWRIGVQDPRNTRTILATTELCDKVIVTSGDYERFFIRNNVRYHHILDPRTGYPASGMQSVTIVAKDGVTADALATAVFVLGPQKGLKIVEKSAGVEALIVDASGRIIMSSGGPEIFDKK